MRGGRNQRQAWGSGFAAAVDLRNKMPAKLHCCFGHSCLLVFISSSAEAKKKAQGAQLAVENWSFLGRANALIASILQGHDCSNLVHLVQFTKNMNIIHDFLCAS
jgi:hypothetical protein